MRDRGRRLQSLAIDLPLKGERPVLALPERAGGMMVKVPTWSVTTPVRRLIPLVAGLLKVKWDGEASGYRRTKSQSISSPERGVPGKGSRRAGEGLGLTAWREPHL